MKILLKFIVVFLVAAAGAGTVIYLDAQCPKKKALLEEQINTGVEKYLQSHTQTIFEHIAKSENFGATVRNFSNISEDDINKYVSDALEKNPIIFENYVRQNADAIAQILAETEVLKNVKAPSSEVQPEAASAETTDTENDENKIYKEHWDEMIKSDVSPSVGPKNAKVTVVEFFDFACGHCKALAPVMSQIIKNNPDVRFIFNPLYFISEHSPYAAKVSLAAAQKGKFEEVYKGIMTLPDMNEDTINQILTDEGLKLDEVKKMVEEKKIRRGIQDIDALSQVLGINGVPMLLINGEAFYGRNLEDIQNQINRYK